MKKTYENTTIVSLVVAFIISGLFIGLAAALDGFLKWLFIALYVACLLYIAIVMCLIDLKKRQAEELEEILNGERLL